jgi:hypothetical protein
MKRRTCWTTTPTVNAMLAKHMKKFYEQMSQGFGSGGGRGGGERDGDGGVAAVAEEAVGPAQHRQ